MDVTKEIELESENLSLIERHGQRARKLRPLLATVVILNVFLFFAAQFYAISWVIASFFLYMYYFIVLLFPTTRRVRSPAEKKKGMKGEPAANRTDAAKAVIRRGKTAVAIAFWNSFFIGTQTLAKGITLILAISVVFAILSGFFLNTLDDFATLVIVAQSLAISTYYMAIMHYRPYSKDFSRTITKVRRSKGAEGRSGNYLKGLAIALLLITLLAILLVSAIFLPGRSIDAVLSTFNINAGFTVLVIVLIFVSQFVIVRYIQGFDSARITTQFIKNKLVFLQSGILSGLDDLERQPESENGNSRFLVLNQRFYASKIYSIAYKDIFGILPTYPIIVNFRAILAKDYAAALGEEIPLDIPSGRPA